MNRRFDTVNMRVVEPWTWKIGRRVDKQWSCIVETFGEEDVIGRMEWDWSWWYGVMVVVPSPAEDLAEAEGKFLRDLMPFDMLIAPFSLVARNCVRRIATTRMDWEVLTARPQDATLEPLVLLEFGQWWDERSVAGWRSEEAQSIR